MWSALRFRGSIRQLLYPKEFRIARVSWTTELTASLEELFSLIAVERKAESVLPEAGLAEDEKMMRLMVNVCTGLWRLKQKMIVPGTERPIEEMRRAYRHLESTWDALADAGVEIQDHTGMPFDAGLSLSAVAFQPMPNIERERVIDTIKPSIYFRKKMIQMGEVIVGRPEKETERTATHSS